MSYTTCAEDSKAIRKRLKSELGLTSKDVSVRSRNYSMGSSIDVRIKSARAANRYSEVKAIAEGKESVRRDGYGDILSGGNRYVFVEIDNAAVENFTAVIAESLDKYGGRFENVEAGIRVYRSNDPADRGEYVVVAYDPGSESRAGSLLAPYGCTSPIAIARLLISKGYGALEADELEKSGPDLTAQREKLQEEAERLEVALASLGEVSVDDVPGIVAVVEETQAAYAKVQDQLSALG